MKMFPKSTTAPYIRTPKNKKTKKIFQDRVLGCWLVVIPPPGGAFIVSVVYNIIIL